MSLATALIDHRLANPKASDQLSLWIRHLVLHVARPRVRRMAQRLARNDARSSSSRSRTPAATCDALAAVYRRGPAAAPAVLPEVGAGVVQGDASEARRRAMPSGTGTTSSTARARRPISSTRWREVDPIDEEFERLAELVMQPLVAPSVRGVACDRAGRSRPLDLRAVPLEGLQVIEASAGTGKTQTITGLYLRLVLERDIPVEQILVVTYTVAATEELRERIRDAAACRRWPRCAGAPSATSMAAELTAAVGRSRGRDPPASSRRCANFDHAAISHDPRLLPARAGGGRVRERPAVRP